MWRRAIGLVILAAAGVLISSSYAQSTPKNLKALKGKSQAEVMKVMAAWNKALGAKCTDCHKAIKTASADDHPNKAISTEMQLMLDDINRRLTTTVKMNCFGCHRGKMKVGEPPADVAGADKADPAILKHMKELTVALSGKYSGKNNVKSISCGTCHHGQAKIPQK